MQIALQSRNVQVEDSVRAAVTEKISRLERFLEGMDRAEVRFHEERNPRIAEREVCEVTLHGHGHVVRARAAAVDASAAVDLVVDKLEHRIEKLKGKLLGRSHPRHGKDNPKKAAANGSLDSALLDSDAPDGDAPGRIVRTKSFVMKPMTTEEAVLQMELLGHAFFLFNDVDTGRASVVYHRRDGDIGLIEAT